MKTFDGKVAAITGAASGIGRALAEDLARRGAALAISDVDPDGLEATAASARSLGARTVTSAVVDVSDREAVYRWADQVADEHGRVNVIINNAGVGLAGTVWDMSDDDLDWLMGINFWGVVNGTRAFLPHLKAAGDGHVVNVSSVFGLFAVPTQSAYNAAKFGVRGFTEALRIELDGERCGVSATTIHPGGIATNIARASRMRGDGGAEATDEERAEAVDQFAKAARTSPESAAEQILRAVEKNKRRAMIGFDARIVDVLTRLAPNTGHRLIGFAARRIAP